MGYSDNFVLQKTHSDSKGQAIIEFALTMPFLLAFILFIVDCGFFAFSYVSLTNSVREGARCAAVGGTDGAVEARVEETYGGPNTPSVDVDRDPLEVGGSVTVTANLDYEWITPVGLVPGISSTTNFVKAATMRLETSTIAKTTC